MTGKTIIRRSVITIATVALLAFVGFQGFRTAMKKNWIKINKYDIRSEGMLGVGDLAPDLELQNADGSGTIALSDLYQEKPVVLTFGSYT